MMATESEQSGEGEQGNQSVLRDLIKLKEVTSSKKTDQEILQALVDNPVVQSLAKAHTALTEKKIYPVSLEAGKLTKEVDDLGEKLDGSAFHELTNLLKKPHVMNLLWCHDAIAKKNKINLDKLYGTSKINGRSQDIEDASTTQRAIRMVGMYKKSWEPLGLTVVKEKNQLKIARILRGSEIERKALLHVDDVILEVNGNLLHGDPAKLQQYLHNTSGSVVFKILPSYEENQPPKLLYIKCHIDYDPAKDELIPCPDAGLSFKHGEILQVVEQNDANWWQAQRVNNKGEARGRAGLIPSQSYEEKRQAVEELKRRNLSSDKDNRKSKKKKSLRRMYNVAQNSAFDKHDIAVYEEVACIPPFSRKVLVILMQSRILGQEICEKIVAANPSDYGISVESRLERSTSGSEEITPKEVHSDQPISIHSQELKSVRAIVKKGKTSVSIATPQHLKLLRTSEFMPYVVFVKMPGDENTDIDEEDLVFRVSNADIGKYYIQYIDAIIDYTSSAETATAIMERLGHCKTKHQWVPTSWVY